MGFKGSLPYPGPPTRAAHAGATGGPVGHEWTTGDVVIDTDGVLWKCTSGGLPGTWSEITEAASLPAGGTSGDVLTKQSSTDGDADWVAPSGATSAFADPVAISGDVADWTADGVGTWTSAGGVISQTNATADSLLQYDTAVPVVGPFVVEADVRLPSGQDSLTTMAAFFCAGGPDQIALAATGTAAVAGEGAALVGDAAGDGAGIVICANVDGNATGLFTTAIAQGDWHTIRAVCSGTRTLVYLDGVLQFADEIISGGNAADPSVSASVDKVMLGAIGKADFRNISVIPLALPA